MFLLHALLFRISVLAIPVSLPVTMYLAALSYHLVHGRGSSSFSDHTLTGIYIVHDKHTSFVIQQSSS